jgi:hypothetical protein
MRKLRSHHDSIAMIVGSGQWTVDVESGSW